MIVVSDTSPLISLSAIGCLDVLPLLFREVFIPEAVRNEVLDAPRELPGVRELLDAEWLIARSLKDRVLVRALQGDLDPGEAEALALAVELRADLLLVDERRARRVAQRLTVPVIGLLGVLLEAKKRGIIRTLRPVFEQLRDRAGFRVNEKLYETILQEAGE